MNALLFLKKHRVLTVIVPILLLVVIVIPILAFANPTNSIEFIDWNTSANCTSDVGASYDRGVNLNSISNVVNLGKFADKSATKYEFAISDIYYEYTDSKKAAQLYAINGNYILGDARRNDEETALMMQQVRLVPDPTIEGIAVDYYLSTNIKSNKIVIKLFKCAFLYKNWDLNIVKGSKIDENGNNVNTYFKDNRNVLLMGSVNYYPKIWQNNGANSTNDYESFEFSYLMVIRHNPNVTVSALDYNYYPEMEQ